MYLHRLYHCPPSEPWLYLTSGESEKVLKLWEHILQTETPLGTGWGSEKERERKEGEGEGEEEEGEIREGGGGGLRSGVPQHLLCRRSEKTQQMRSNFISWRKLSLRVWFFLNCHKESQVCAYIHLCHRQTFLTCMLAMLSPQGSFLHVYASSSARFIFS